MFQLDSGLEELLTCTLRLGTYLMEHLHLALHQSLINTIDSLYFSQNEP
jgi:hypothetical protein